MGALEQAITDYLPIALERLSAVLADPEARAMVEGALRTAFDHSVRDLLLHEWVLAKLVVTDRTIERLVDGFEREGFDRFEESLAEPRLKAQVARAVNDAVVNFLRLSLAERLRRLSPERRIALSRTLGTGWCGWRGIRRRGARWSGRWTGCSRPPSGTPGASCWASCAG